MSRAFSNCDVLFLETTRGNRDSYTIWSPLTSVRSVVVNCPYSFRDPRRQGICYDPITDDVKVVVVAWGYYTVYSCNNNWWTRNGKRAPRCFFFDIVENSSPVTVDGAVYWAENHSREIVFFDPTADEFKSLPLPEMSVEGKFGLVCLGGILCLWSRLERGVRFWMKGKGKDEESWEEMMRIENREMMSRARKTFEPLCLVGDKIAIRLDDGVIAVYSPREDAFEAISGKDRLKFCESNVKGRLNKFDHQLVLGKESIHMRIRKNHLIWRLEKFLQDNEDGDLSDDDDLYHTREDPLVTTSRFSLDMCSEESMTYSLMIVFVSFSAAICFVGWLES